MGRYETEGLSPSRSLAERIGHAHAAADFVAQSINGRTTARPSGAEAYRLVQAGYIRYDQSTGQWRSTVLESAAYQSMLGRVPGLAHAVGDAYHERMAVLMRQGALASALRTLEVPLLVALVGVSAATTAGTSETRYAVSNLGRNAAVRNSDVLSQVGVDEGLSGVYDHATGNILLRRSFPNSQMGSAPAGSVAQYGGHVNVADDLGAATGENFTTSETVGGQRWVELSESLRGTGRLSGFSAVRTQTGWELRFNSNSVNGVTHGQQAVPEGLQQAIRDAFGALQAP